MTVVEKLHGDFVDALNDELAALGATVRVDRSTAPTSGVIVLQDDAGHTFGSLPRHADAATIYALEKILIRARVDSIAAAVAH